MHLLFAITGTVGGRPLPNEEDMRLIQRIVDGEESAMSALYDRYSRMLYTFGMRILRSNEDTSDVLQEVFLQAWNKARSYESGKGTVFTWLVTMMRNRAIDLVRSRRYKEQARTLELNELSLVADARPSNPHATAVLGEDQRMVVSALQRLTKDQQQIIALAYYEGYSQSEIASKLSIPLGTVKSRMRKGLMEMRAMLHKGL